MGKSILYEGISVSFTDKGTGKAIVLLHGYLEAKGVWAPLSTILGTEYRIVAIDLPGHGKSGIASNTHTMEFMAGAVKAVIDFLGLPVVLMVGHSLGGYVTLAFLEKFPDSLTGYCLFHSHPHPDTPSGRENRLRELEIVKAGKKNVIYTGNITRMFAEKNLDKMSEAVIHSKRIASKTPAEGIIAVVNGMIIRPSRKELFQKGIKPLLWILGRGDQYFTPDAVASTVKLPANAKMVVLENSGHMGFVEETALSAKLITEFASGLDWNC
jgi:pimeloyl-ACP methyl ester carboxylesterase